MQMQNSNRFITRDLYLAAFLLASNLLILEIEPDKSESYLWFIVENYDRCKELEKNYWDQKALVEPLAYINATRTLKQRIIRYQSDPSQ
jgi:hypothetical protein